MEWYQDRHSVVARSISTLKRYHEESQTEPLYLDLKKVEVGEVTFVVLLEGSTYESPEKVITGAFLIGPDGKPQGELPFRSAPAAEGSSLPVVPQPQYRIVKDGVRAVIVTATYGYRIVTLAVTKDKVYILSCQSTSR